MNFKMPTAYVDAPCKWMSSIHSDMSEEERLKTENAKLRELLHEALLFGDEMSYQEIRYRLKQQARELGVEAGA